MALIHRILLFRHFVSTSFFIYHHQHQTRIIAARRHIVEQRICDTQINGFKEHPSIQVTEQLIVGVCVAVGFYRRIITVSATLSFSASVSAMSFGSDSPMTSTLSSATVSAMHLPSSTLLMITVTHLGVYHRKYRTRWGTNTATRHVNQYIQPNHHVDILVGHISRLSSCYRQLEQVPAARSREINQSRTIALEIRARLPDLCATARLLGCFCLAAAGYEHCSCRVSR